MSREKYSLLLTAKINRHEKLFLLLTSRIIPSEKYFFPLAVKKHFPPDQKKKTPPPPPPPPKKKKKLVVFAKMEKNYVNCKNGLSNVIHIPFL